MSQPFLVLTTGRHLHKMFFGCILRRRGDLRMDAGKDGRYESIDAVYCLGAFRHCPHDAPVRLLILPALPRVRRLAPIRR